MKKAHPNDNPPAGQIRLRLLVAYAGDSFAGWQSQAAGGAVQDALEAAVRHFVGERRVVHGSGRTDAGVHASGQVAHVDVPEQRLAVQAWAAALNAHLPRAVRVLEARRAPAGFHARFSATGKEYEYRLWNHACLHPLEVGRVWHVPAPVDTLLLRECAALLEGTHDFRGFSANRGQPEENTVRTLFQVGVRVSGPLVSLRFRGDGFLYRMVRLLTGSLVRVAQGKSARTWLQQILEKPGVARSSFSAPAEGLYLRKVSYR